MSSCKRVVQLGFNAYSSSFVRRVGQRQISQLTSNGQPSTEVLQEANLSKFKSEDKSFQELQRQTQKLQGAIEKLISEQRYEIEKALAPLQQEIDAITANLEAAKNDVTAELVAAKYDVPRDCIGAAVLITGVFIFAIGPALKRKKGEDFV